MKLDMLLSRLEKVRQRGPDAWIACCPAHPDRNPSMTIAHKSGSILLHCFAGCGVDDIVTAVGMELSDLFPDEPKGKVPRHRFMPADVLACLQSEINFMAVIAASLADGYELTAEDRGRLKTAAKRFDAARQAAAI